MWLTGQLGRERPNTLRPNTVGVQTDCGMRCKTQIMHLALEIMHIKISSSTDHFNQLFIIRFLRKNFHELLAIRFIIQKINLLGPFTIVEPVGPIAFKLDLPDTLQRLHPVFHASLLTKYNDQGGSKPLPPILMEDGSLEYEVERILDSRPCGLLGRPSP